MTWGGGDRGWLKRKVKAERKARAADVSKHPAKPAFERGWRHPLFLFQEPKMNRDRKEYLRRYQNEWMKKRRIGWFKAVGPCWRCGSSDRLEVHHINREAKISHAVWSWSEERMDSELAKCVPLCRSCHVEITKLQNSKPLVHGTYLAYNKKKCRCALCRASNAERSRIQKISGRSTERTKNLDLSHRKYPKLDLTEWRRWRKEQDKAVRLATQVLPGKKK